MKPKVKLKLMYTGSCLVPTGHVYQARCANCDVARSTYLIFAQAAQASKMATGMCVIQEHGSKS